MVRTGQWGQRLPQRGGDSALDASAEAPKAPALYYSSPLKGESIRVAGASFGRACNGSNLDALSRFRLVDQSCSVFYDP